MKPPLTAARCQRVEISLHRHTPLDLIAREHQASCSNKMLWRQTAQTHKALLWIEIACYLFDALLLCNSQTHSDTSNEYGKYDICRLLSQRE
jgi:hypothetical protein